MRPVFQSLPDSGPFGHAKGDVVRRLTSAKQRLRRAERAHSATAARVAAATALRDHWAGELARYAGSADEESD